MIQDISPRKLDFTYCNHTITRLDKILIFRNNEVFLKSDGSEELFPEYGELEEAYSIDSDSFKYIFSIDGSRYFLYINPVEDVLQGLTHSPVNIFRTLKPGYEAFAGITAYHLYNWYNNNQFCGHCGNPMSHAENERSLRCESCKNIVYPRISPAVIIGVTDGNRLLMSRYSNGSYRHLALLAGFCEIGETLEETVKREVFEETGLKVKNIRYYKSQPWGFSESLLAGFYAELDGSDTINIDTSELAEAQWYDRDDIPEPPLNISLTSEMIMAFKYGDKLNLHSVDRVVNQQTIL